MRHTGLGRRSPTVTVPSRAHANAVFPPAYIYISYEPPPPPPPRFHGDAIGGSYIYMLYYIRSSDQLLCVHISFDIMYNIIIHIVCIFVCNNARESLYRIAASAFVATSPSSVLLIISFINVLSKASLRDYCTEVSPSYIIIIVISHVLYTLWSCVKTYFLFYCRDVSHNVYVHNSCQRSVLGSTGLCGIIFNY